MSKALELAKFGRETPPTGVVVGDTDTQTLSSKTFSDMPVFSGGTVNTVPYLNASKVLSSSTTLAFDGTNLGVGVASPGFRLDVGGGDGTNIGLRSTGTSDAVLRGYVNGAESGTVRFINGGGIKFETAGNMRITINSSGNVGIGTAPTTGSALQVLGLTDFWHSTNTLLRAQHDGTRSRLQSYTGGAVGNIALNPDGGNVGVGTDSPAYKLEVLSGTESSGQVPVANFRTGSSTAGYNAGIMVYATASATATSRSVNMIWDADAANAVGGDYFYINKLGNSGDVQIYQASNAAMTFSTYNTERMRILAGGNISFGSTGTADRPVHLVGTGNRQYFRAETTTNNIANEAGFDIKTPNSNFLIGSHGSTNALWIYDINAAAERLRIDSAGNILVSSYSNTGGGKIDLTSNATAVIQARSTATGTGDGTADVSVIRAVTAGASWWANARYDAFSHTWGYGPSATSNIAMRLTGNGNLAIGTTSNTTEKLNINGSAWFIANNDANYSTIIAPRYDSSWSFTMQTRLNSASFSEWLGLYSDSGGADPRLALVPNGWRVGIGTTAPATKLSVNNVSHNSPTDGNRILNWYATTGGSELWNSVHGISVGNNSDSTAQPQYVGLSLFNRNSTADIWSPAITFGGLSTSGNYMNGVAGIAAKLRTNTDDGNFRAGDLHFFTQGTNQAGKGLSSKMILDAAGNLNILTTIDNSVNSYALPGAIKFTGSGWNTVLGTKPTGGQISLAGAYSELNGGSTEPSLVFSLYGTGSGGYNTTAGPTTLTERMRINNYGKVTVTGNIVSTLGGPIYETIDCLNINPAGTSFESVTHNSDGGGTYWQVVGGRVVDLYSTSGGHGGSWGFPVRIDTPGYYRLKIVARLSSTNGSIHSSTPAGNYKYSIPIGFVLNTFSVYGKWDVDALGNGTRVCAIGTPAYCSAGTYQMTYSTSGYDGIKQIYLYEVVVERVG